MSTTLFYSNALGKQIGSLSSDAISKSFADYLRKFDLSYRNSNAIYWATPSAEWKRFIESNGNQVIRHSKRIGTSYAGLAFDVLKEWHENIWITYSILSIEDEKRYLDPSFTEPWPIIADDKLIVDRWPLVEDKMKEYPPVELDDLMLCLEMELKRLSMLPTAAQQPPPPSYDRIASELRTRPLTLAEAASLMGYKQAKRVEILSRSIRDGSIPAEKLNRQSYIFSRDSFPKEVFSKIIPSKTDTI